MYLGGKLLLGYIDGSVVEPDVTDTKHAEWKAYNMMIMSWMLNSMEPDVSEGLYELNTTKEVWDTVYDLYADKNNMARIHEVKQLIANHRQGDTSASSYYTKLRSDWQELAYLRNIEFHCQKDAEEYKKRVEMDQVFDFLARLNSAFEPVRAKILNETVLPSLSAAFALVLKDEKRRVVMSTNPLEGSALTAIQGRGRGRGQGNVDINVTFGRGRNQGRGQGRGTGRGRARVEDRVCTHCGRKNHTVDTCWDLHGKLQT